VMCADAVNVAAAPLGEPVRGLHPAFGDEDAQVGAMESGGSAAVLGWEFRSAREPPTPNRCGSG
jgi:hypothetical protein